MRLAIATLAIALISGSGIALVGLNHNDSSPVSRAKAPASSTASVGTEPSETIDDSTKNRKIVVSSSDKDAILVDVPDDQIDHADLEEFIEKRPMDAYRIVHVNSDALRTVVRRVNQQPSFELQLLNTSPVTLVAEDAEEHSSGWQSGLATWRGTVAGADYSYAMFIVSPDGSVNGKVRSRDFGRIAIEPIPNTPYHIVWQLQDGFSQKID